MTTKEAITSKRIRPFAKASDFPAPRSSASRPNKKKKTNGTRLAAFARWVQIYVSMFGLALTLFFSLTGITLNHPDWFAGESVITLDGEIDDALLNDLRNPKSTTARLQIVEQLRADHQVSGSVKDFTADEFQSLIIDISALLLTLISATGLMLILWLRRKRLKGLVTMAVGALILIVLCVFLMP